MPRDDFAYTCSTCGGKHVGLPDLAFDAPWHYHVLSARGRSAATLTSDTCVIDDDRFVRGVLLLPIVGQDESFGLGVWVSLSAQSYQEYLSSFDAMERPTVGPWFGWLCSRIPGYPETLNLKTSVVPQGSRSRPLIEIEPTAHPLSLEQHSGISLDRLGRVLEANEHPPVNSRGLA